MIVARTVQDIRSAVASARGGGARIGLVPTMGALHEGHFSLVEAARRECPFVVVSIFVNPIQFAPNEDYQRYPRPVEQDLSGCRRHGVGAVFLPTAEAMYPAGFATTVHVSGLTEGLCGAARKGHFDGVCTAVAKLFHIVGADVAYFGAKDYQQAIMVRRMVADLDFPVEVRLCPTWREKDGLAMSSRNAYLTSPERRQAAALCASLRLGEKMIRQRRSVEEVVQAVRRHLAEHAPLASVEYVEVIDPDGLRPVRSIDGPVVIAEAVKFPSARLIDNIRVDGPTSAG